MLFCFYYVDVDVVVAVVVSLTQLHPANHLLQNGDAGERMNDFLKFLLHDDASTRRLRIVQQQNLPHFVITRQQPLAQTLHKVVESAAESEHGFF